jgi:uncharacterized protein YndB with AHSA1/START domain
MIGTPGETRTDPDGTRVLVFHREYPDPVDDVWAAVTESDRLARWIGTWTGRPRPGGTVAFTMTGEADAGGEVADPVDVTIAECEPPHRLVVDIPESGSDRSWRIALTVTERTGGSLLLFEQRLPEGLDTVDVEAGWRWYLDRLGASLRGEPMPAWEAYTP